MVSPRHQLEQQQQHEHKHHLQYQHHNEMQKIHLQQHQQHQQRLLQQRQSQMSSRHNNDFRGAGSSHIKGYIDPNHFHQQQQLQLKLQLQQDEHMQQQQVQLQNFQLQRALPNHQQRQHHVGASGNFGTMADTLRHRQHHLLASAASCNPSIWGVPPPVISSRHQHLLERELKPCNDYGASRKRTSTAVSGDTANTGNSNRNNSKTDSKQTVRSEKKRDQEKQRRSDLNEKFAALIQVVKRIETEDDEVEQKGAEVDEVKRKRKLEQEAEEWEVQAQSKNTKSEEREGTEEDAGLYNGSGDGSTSSTENSRKKLKVDIASISVSSTAMMISAGRRDFKRRFPCFISPSNRSDLIARAVSHLIEYSKIRNKLNVDIDALRNRVEDVRRGNAESEQKLMMASPSANPMIVLADDNSKITDNADSSLATGDTDKKPSPPSSMTVTKDELHQPQQQQQQQQPQMMMMMPMIVNPDGSFNQQCPQQFMPMPMSSMGTHLFNNMMMIPPISQAVPPSTVEQQGQQKGHQHDQGGTHSQQEQQGQSQSDSADWDEKSLRIETPVANVSDDSTREAIISPSASGASSSRFSSCPPSPLPSYEAKVSVDTGFTMPCTESKMDLPTVSGTSSNYIKQHHNALPKEERPLQPSFTDVVDDKPINAESKLTSPLGELQQKPTFNNVVPTEEKETHSEPGASGKEMKSCSNGTKATKDPSNETTSKVSNPVTPSAKPDYPMSPATNLLNSEQKIFPSTATQSPETVSKRGDAGTIDATQAGNPSEEETTTTRELSPAKANQKSVETIEEPKLDTGEPQTDEKDATKKEGPKKSRRISQTTEALASTLLGLSRSPE